MAKTGKGQQTNNSTKIQHKQLKAEQQKRHQNCG